MTDKQLADIRAIHERRQTTTDDYRRTWDTDFLMLSIPMLLDEVERLRAAQHDPAAYSIVHPDGRPSERSFYVRQERKESRPDDTQ